MREKQRKKASYNAKLAKFQAKEDVKPKGPGDAKIKAKMFEDMEGQKEREKEAQIRKESFEKKREAFDEENKEDVEEAEEPLEDALAKKKAVFEADEAEVDDDMTEVLERERRREEFLEKQTVFGK